MKAVKSAEWPQWLLQRYPGTLVSHSPPQSHASLSPFELAMVKCACIYSDIWRTKALCKCKCKICRVTIQRWMVSGEAELSDWSDYHWFIAKFRQTINPTPIPVHTQYGLSLITFGTINLKSSFKYPSERGSLEMGQIFSVTLSKWIPIICRTVSGG